MDIGSKAPAFSLADKNGKIVSLSDFAGKKVVIYFYPKDNTSGCTKQACSFAANHAAFEQVMAAVSDFEKGNMRLSLVLASLEG